MQQLLKEYGHSKTIVTLGDSARHRSICNGIRHLASSAKEPDGVVIHDAVRPFVDEQIVNEVASAANEHGVIRPIQTFDRKITQRTYYSRMVGFSFKMTTVGNILLQLG